ALRELKRQSASPFVFASERGGPFTRRPSPTTSSGRITEPIYLIVSWASQSPRHFPTCRAGALSAVSANRPIQPSLNGRQSCGVLPATGLFFPSRRLAIGFRFGRDSFVVGFDPEGVAPRRAD